MSTENSTIRWDKDADGIVILTLDDPSQSANTMNAAYVDSMRATVTRLQEERDEIKGVIIASAKKTFFAGGDLNELRPVTQGERRGVRRLPARGQGAAAHDRDARHAGRRGDQRRRAGWRS